MPRISKKNISIYHKDITRRAEFVINYNSDWSFYAEIPKEFTEVVNHLTESKFKELSIDKYYKSKYQRGVYKFIVYSDTESGLVEVMTKAIKYFVDQTIEQRKVILLFYEGDYECNYSGHEYNDKHPQIGMRLGLTYAIETRSGDKKIYSTYREVQYVTTKETVRSEIRLWNNRVTVIPDTKDNRETLELLYSNFDKLNKKLKEITKTGDALLSFIDSKQKLLQ